MARARLRDLGIAIGHWPPGPLNALTDVPGVLVGHATIIADRPRVARTGVTVVVPRGDAVGAGDVFAGFESFNGNGEMTGLLWVAESGLLTTPIGITNTQDVGVVRDALSAHLYDRDPAARFFLPVAAETYDGWLSDIRAAHVTPAHVEAALRAAAGGPVAEGNVGGGTGMICHEFKGGIGTASRVVATRSDRYTVGALVQANYGHRRLLRVDGVPVGREIDHARVPSAWGAPRHEAGSIIAILATDAPLLPGQCARLARRATVGLARVGGVGHNGSGDVFLAFATGNALPPDPPAPASVRMLPHAHLDPLFEGAAEAVEEAILNALTGAETMTGQEGRTAHAIPLDAFARIVARDRSRGAGPGGDG
jgi:D-aminopeptidase